ncbi:MAG: hypothetical protein WBL70_01655 [Candidatus Acidiferrales bacterium]
MRIRERAPRGNLSVATSTWGQLSKPARRGLAALSKKYFLSVALGDVQYIDGRWYVTHAGLLRLAERRRCAGISTSVQPQLSDPKLERWVFKAIVYKSPSSRGFAGYGDADPSNVSPLVRGAEMRVAETRAVNRALRKAYGIGLCSVEELGCVSVPAASSVGKGTSAPPSNGNGSSNGQPRLRDRLCLLVRQHQLDPSAVKRYAAEFCGTPELREASRERVESFITHLTEWAGKDRPGLVCKLNSYSQREEVQQ